KQPPPPRDLVRLANDDLANTILARKAQDRVGDVLAFESEHGRAKLIGQRQSIGKKPLRYGINASRILRRRLYIGSGPVAIKPSGQARAETEQPGAVGTARRQADHDLIRDSADRLIGLRFAATRVDLRRQFAQGQLAEVFEISGLEEILQRGLYSLLWID